MKYNIITYGCQMNEHDSERIAFILESLGYEKTEDQSEADFLVYNTCLIRENAELKVYGHLGAIKKQKRENPDLLIAVCGCMMQTGPARHVIEKKYPHVDIIFGTSNIDKLPELINMSRTTGRLVVDIDQYIDDPTIGYSRNNDFSAYVNIMTGCNNFCTYCIVPYARGREKSRPIDEIVREVRSLVDRGFIEVTLLGQNVNSYGKELGVSFPELLYQIAKEVPDLPLLRFVTSHPKDLSDELIYAMRDIPMIEKHFHLPLQSGSSKVLKEMNRRYTREDYMERLNKLREEVPGIAISTDLIVGFPGETEEDHEETMSLCREARFESAYTFIYSRRPGTPADEREDQVPDEVKSRRFNELLDVIYPIFHEKNLEEVGSVQEVLLENVSKNNDQVLSGRSLTNKLVHVKADKKYIGKLVKVKINRCTSFTLEGELCD